MEKDIKDELKYELKYARELLKKTEDIRTGIYYYITRCQALERENEYLRNAYENRVNKFLKEKEE